MREKRRHRRKPQPLLIHLTVEKRAKRMPDTTVEITFFIKLLNSFNDVALNLNQSLLKGTLTTFCLEKDKKHGKDIKQAMISLQEVAVFNSLYGL